MNMLDPTGWATSMQAPNAGRWPKRRIAAPKGSFRGTYRTNDWLASLDLSLLRPFTSVAISIGHEEDLVARVLSGQLRMLLREMRQRLLDQIVFAFASDQLAAGAWKPRLLVSAVRHGSERYQASGSAVLKLFL
jgi:hypothetical protein